MPNNKIVKILIVGKKSFIGSNLKKYLSKYYKLNQLSYENTIKLSDYKFNTYSHVINTSIHKLYVKKKYNSNYDLDRKLSKKIKNKKLIYIFLNSRKVYKPAFNLKEHSLIKPKTFYARNKNYTEKFLINNFKNNLLSLRISNVIGKRLFKRTRKAHEIFFDNFLKYRKKNKKIIVNNDFKDFISINQFNLILKDIIKYRLLGIYNLSLGQKIYISELLKWLDINFYKLIIFKKSTKDSFTLSNKKLLSKLDVKISKNQLRLFCKKLFKKK